jgi:hypothetical protein
MLESRIFTLKAFPRRLCLTTRRHRPSNTSCLTYLNNSTANNNYLPAARLFSTSRAQFCTKYQNDLCNSIRFRPKALTSPPIQLFHTMPSNQDNRPEVGTGSGHLEEGASKKDDDWKNRPPYRTTNTNKEFDKKYTAHCHCGRVKYWLSREKPLGTKFCHCIDCQALHGMHHLLPYCNCIYIHTGP